MFLRIVLQVTHCTSEGSEEFYSFCFPFQAIANQPWAQKLMFNSPGFVEYVMDRSVEHDKASKDAKYELVKALANSKTVAEIFGNPNYLRLRTYLSEGPYYVKPISTTAVEGAE